jgi:hypothetical protein
LDGITRDGEGDDQVEAPMELVALTVNVYVVAADKPVIVYEEPVPLIAVPTDGVIVQFPVGNPFNTTEPAAVAQVGCVIIPTDGIETAGFTVIAVLLETN